MSFLTDYAEVFKELELTELCVEAEGIKIRFSKAPSERLAKSDIPSEDIKTVPDKNEKVVSIGTLVKAPLLGVFYSEVNGRVIKEGDRVKRGDLLCSIEAMKMMNEVKAPVDGVVRKALAKDGDLVEYDQLLFEIA